MDAEPSADKAASSKRRSRSRSTLSRRSIEDSSNADSNGSSVEKEVSSKDAELHNGAVGETEDAIRENAPKTATEVSSVNAKGEERHGEKVPRVGDKWKLHLDLSDSCSLSENDASDVDGISAPSASNPADEGQVEEPETKPSVLKDDDKRVAESVADDTSVLSDTSEFCGFEDSSSDQDYIEALIAIIQKCETTDDDCCLSSDEIPSSPKTEPEYDPARTYSHDDDSNSSSVFGHYDSGKDVLSPPASHLNVPSSKGKQKVKYSGSPVPSTSRSGTSKKLSIDLSNPAFRKPLDMGWKREIVFRSAGGSSTKGLADVYYFTPSGKKVRSTREMMENLEGTDLTLDNFTFTKEPLGINDPDKEVIRDARRTSVTPKDTGSPSTPTASSVKRIQKLKASAGEMSPVSDQSSASGPSNVKQEPMSVEEETDGLSESSSSGSVNRDQGATPADTSGAAEQKIPPAIAGPSGLNKHAGRSQSHLKLARSFPRIKVTSPRSGRGRGQTSPRGGGVNRGVTSQAGGSGGNMEIGMLPPMWKDKDGASTTKVLSSPGAAPALQSTPSRGPGRLPRGGKGGGQVAVPPKVCTVNAGATATATVTVTTGETVLGPAKKYGVCTIQCPGLLGTVPSLQCQLCLCLYHSECVGLGSINTSMRNYICKNCQLEKDKKSTSVTTTVVTAAPPPLTPISSLEGPKNGHSSVNSSAMRGAQPSGVLPPLRRFPRQDNKTSLAPFAAPTAACAPLCSSVSTNTTGTMTSAVPTSATSASTKFVMVPTYVQTEQPSARPGAPPPLARLPRQDGKTAPVGIAAPNVASLSLCSSVPTGTTGTTSFVGAASSQSPSPKLVMVPTYVKLDQADRATQTLTNAVTTVSIVGSVTTWLPPSSQIRVSGPGGCLRPPLPAVSPAAATLTGCPPPPPPVSQGLMRAGGRRYIVLPKHNVLSVSPAGATLTTRPAGPDAVTAFSASRGMTPLCDIRSQLPPSTQTAYLIGAQNPPGVLLVPVLGSPGASVPGMGASLPVNQDKQQILLVNGSPAGSPGGFVLSATAATGMDAAAESRKRKAAASPPEEAAGVSKKPRTMDAANGDAEPLRAFMSRYMANVCETYNAMLHIFEYLKVQEVLRAARVCRLWCSVATHDSLWQTVRLKNSPVADWKGCVATLAKRGTRHLDMRKMLVPAGRADEWWAAFCANIGRVPCLESVELCRCPAAVVERVAQQCPQLTTLSALSIKDQSINLSSIGQLKNLQELRIRNLSGMYLNGNLDGLKELTNLKHLSLTMVKNLGHAGCGVLGSLQTLETLELGECCDLPESFGNQTLSQLHSLQRLRLEKGQGDGCPTFALLASVRTLPSLVTLELVNFDVKPGFDTALARCQNVRRLLIIPTYISQSATTNHMVLGGVTKLGDSLTHFVWGVTHELLRVTELFVDQCEDQKGPPGSHTGKDKEKKKSYTPPLPGAGAGDSIPVLRPVPGSIPPDDGGNKSTDSRTRGEGSSPTSNSSSAVPTPGAPQVDILPLTKLQKMLTTALPNTKIKILKVAFQATWRQYISETDF
ncbi:uncharacterized protein LOC124551348 isoform X1 [Schistocerca americana]|uniref:uncharacterized protein LOC124551348 isoform X1 n=1 Tax=Schistocerca americana TaxID=7009 RepID=UPI001F4FAE69|nr:uncharacterized protein LOC124551348 isoform X1 [Schistocerca americana]XP_046982336.1 uncharacterized protein LOC124551348 isoform X1 [Schistocerca americana]